MNYLALHRHALRHPAIFVLGFREAFRGDMGMTYDNDPDAPRSVAYDLGRNTQRAMFR